MEPIITTNHNPDEIEVNSKYDENFKIWRVDVKLRKLKGDKKLEKDETLSGKEILIYLIISIILMSIVMSI